MKRRKYVLGDKLFAEAADGRTVIVGRIDSDDGVGSSEAARRRLIRRLNKDDPEKRSSGVRPGGKT